MRAPNIARDLTLAFGTAMPVFVLSFNAVWGVTAALWLDRNGAPRLARGTRP